MARNGTHSGKIIIYKVDFTYFPLKYIYESKKMEGNMTVYEAEKIIEKLAENKGLIWEKRKSITSSSLYYTLFLGKSSLMFQINYTFA